jgi:hypothetical protein
MNNNALFIGWNRWTPGRERQSLEHFQEFLTYLGKQQQQGSITGYTPVVLAAHGGDLNGFVLVTGENGAISKLTREEAFLDHEARAGVNMTSLGVLPAYTGPEMQKWLQRVARFI